MDRKDRMDGFGATALVTFAVILAFNQVVIKVGNEGLQPVFMAGLRSLLAVPVIVGFMAWRGRSLCFPRPLIGHALILGTFFAVEFIFLFLSLDLTTVARTSIIFYSMPLWLALGAHVFLPGERMSPVKAAGLLIALAGVAWAILDRTAGVSGEASLLGDLLALAAALAWAAIALFARATRLRELDFEMQILCQVVISVPILLGASLFLGPLIRDLEPIHLWGLAFQSIVIVSAGFMFWFWMLTIYPASSVASFSFLTPVLGVIFGWLMLGEEIGFTIFGAVALVAIGILLINRPQVPQKVA